MEETENQEKVLCKYCLENINKGSKVCHHCGKDQRSVLNKIQYFASAITLIMVVIAVIQVSINYLQVQELKHKRIEAEDVLKKANLVFSNASTISNKAIEKSLTVLTSAENSAKSAEAVTGKAEKEMKNTVNSVNTQLNVSNKRINRTEKEYDDIKGNVQALRVELLSQLDVLKKRNELTALADKAMSGDRNAFNKLAEMAHKDTAAMSEMLMVKSFYLSCTRIPEFADLTVTDTAGAVLKNDKILTKDLIDNLLNNPDWRIRGRAAQLLRTRKEKEVPEALIESMKNENELDVLRYSIDSFSTLTGYQSIDVLDYLQLIKWWSQNENRIEKDFK